MNQPDDEITSGGQAAATVIDQVEVPDFRFIVVTLTYDGFLPFKFKFKRQQSQEVKDAKQAFYGKSEEEQTETLKPYRVNIMAQLLVERPLNVQGFPETSDFRADFVTYFNDPDNDDMLQWVWSQYQEKLYPKELLSSPLE